jgi:hypothetical protein
MKRMLTYLGQTRSIRDWAEEYNHPPARLIKRLQLGWTIADALHVPVISRCQHFHARAGA